MQGPVRKIKYRVPLLIRGAIDDTLGIKSLIAIAKELRNQANIKTHKKPFV
jgi:hypothetical protein